MMDFLQPVAFADFNKGMTPAGNKSVPGNIDIYNRPILKNPDGSISTVSTISVGMPEGEVLIPTISPEGKRWTEEEAIAAYRKTGEHLGIFGTPEEATKYAQKLHRQQEQFYSRQGK